MDNKQTFYKNQITDLCNAYKSIAILSFLEIEKGRLEKVLALHKNLEEIFDKIVKRVKLLNDDKTLKKVQSTEFEELPEYLSEIKNVVSYKKLLSLKYSQLDGKTLEDNIVINKMSIEFNPSEEIPYLSIGQALFDNGHYLEVIKLCEFIKTISDTAPVWKLIGDAYRKLGQYGFCIESYQKYLELNEDDYEMKDELNKVYEEALVKYE
jgi:tetratricopeptide (TPR) repeat protein